MPGASETFRLEVRGTLVAILRLHAMAPTGTGAWVSVPHICRLQEDSPQPTQLGTEPCTFTSCHGIWHRSQAGINKCLKEDLV